MATIHELATQAAWEMEGVRRAIIRYEEAEAEQDPMTLPPGKALIRGVVGPLIAAIVQLRDETADQLRSPHGRKAPWAWILQTLDPKKTAVITLNVAVNTTAYTTTGAAGLVARSALPSVTLRLCAALRDQVEYDRWCEQEPVRMAAAKIAGEEPEDRLKALRLRYPNLDRRVWAKWRGKLKLARSEPWTKEQQIGLGGALVHLLVTVAPDRFIVSERPASGGVQYFLDVTPAVREVLNDVRERAMVARPLLMPMIIPPLPWRYEDAA